MSENLNLIKWILDNPALVQKILKMIKLRIAGYSVNFSTGFKKTEVS